MVISNGPAAGAVSGGPPNAPDESPSLVENASGSPFVAFASNVSGAGWEIFFANGSTQGSGFSTPVPVSGAPPTGEEYVSPTIAVNAAGTESCITFDETAVSNVNLGVGNYEESCSTNGGRSWSALQTDNGLSANVCTWGTLYSPVGAFDSAGNYLVSYVCSLYSNSSLALGWDLFNSANVWKSSHGFPIASYTSFAPTIAFACGSASAGCATAYSITDGTGTDWHLLVVSSTSDFSGRPVGPLAIESVPVPAGGARALQVFGGGLAFASSGDVGGAAYLALASGSTTSFNVHFANTSNAWTTSHGITVDPAPPPGTGASGLSAPSLALEGSSGAPFVDWDNQSGTVTFAAASSAPGSAWSNATSPSLGGGWPAVAVLSAGGSTPWREDLVYLGSAAPSAVLYAQLLGPSLGSILSDHPGGEVGLAVNFTAVGAAGGFPPYTYAWSMTPSSGLGCPATFGLRLACVPTVPGSFTLDAQLVDSGGFLSPVLGLPGFPVVSALGVSSPVGWPSSTLGDVGQSVFLNATGSGGSTPYTASWSGLPAGCAASSALSVSCTLAGPPGPCSVAAAVHDAFNYNASSASLAYTVYASPSVSSVYGSPNPAGANVSVTFTATVSGGAPPLTYAWSFGHGSSSGQASPTHAFPAGGSYPVWLNVTDGAGVTARGAMTESVDSAMGVSVSVGPANPRPGYFAFLNATVTGGTPSYTYDWNFGDGTRGTGAQAQHIYAAAGSYTAVVFVNDSLGSMATGQLTFSVFAPPTGLAVSPATATPNPANTTTVVSFSVSASGGTAPYSYLWDFGDGSPFGSGANVSHLFTAPSTGPGYLVNVTVSDSAGHYDSQTFYEVVVAGTGAPPLVVEGLTANPRPSELGLPVTFTARVEGGLAPLLYSWSFGDGQTAGGSTNTVSHVYALTGNENAEVQVVDARGSMGEAQVTVAVNPDPSVHLTIEPDDGTAPLRLALQASVSGGVGPYSFQFRFGDGTATPPQSNASYTHVYAAGGTFEVVVMVSDELGGQATGFSNVTLAAPPPPPGAPAPSLSPTYFEWLVLDPWFLLGLVVVLSAVVVATVLSRRREARSALSAGWERPAVYDPDALAPKARAPSGAIADDTAEDPVPTAPPTRLPMLAPPRSSTPGPKEGPARSAYALAGAGQPEPAAPTPGSGLTSGLEPPAAPPPAAVEIPRPVPISAASSAPLSTGPGIAPISSATPPAAPIRAPTPGASSEERPPIRNCLLCGNTLPPEQYCDNCQVRWGTPSGSPSMSSRPTETAVPRSLDEVPTRSAAPAPSTPSRGTSPTAPSEGGGSPGKAHEISAARPSTASPPPTCFICGSLLKDGKCPHCGMSWLDSA